MNDNGITKNYVQPTIPDNPIPGVVVTGQINAGSVSGNLTQPTMADTQFTQQNVARYLISDSLDTLSKKIKSNYTFSQQGAIQIGQILISPVGILGQDLLGGTTFALDPATGSATFKGTILAGTIVSGYIPTGGAAGDVNGGVTTISGGKITTGSITATQIAAGTITATEIASSAITATKIAANVISTTHLDTSILSAGKIVASILTASNITTGTLDASVVTVTNLNASNIKTGTLTVGGTGNPDAIVLVRDSGGTGTKLRWEGGSRIWSDSSNNMGMNAIGGTIIFYSNSTEIFQMNSGGLNISSDVTCKNLFLNQGQVEGSIRKVDVIRGYNDLRFWTGDGGTADDYKFLRDSGAANAVRIEHDTGKIHSLASAIDLGGSDKTAIVPVKEGYRALYCVESPEVWFMDFAKDKDSIDPMFLEVTEGKMLFMPAWDENEVPMLQVWRRRKLHAEKRFEIKTEMQFAKNERFLQQAK